MNVVNRPELTLIVALTLLLLLSPTIAGQTTRQKHSLERSLKASGYVIKTNSYVQPTDWEKEQFQLLGKYRIDVRRTKPMSEALDTYPRYAVEIEAYSSEADAEKRLERLRDTPPGLDTKMHAEYLLRDGFRRGEFVYVISTDAAAFSVKYLQQLKKKLERTVP